ncbi:Os12g0444600 [Oryza sativa Japonica Group]|uniref:Os12g0444600 protein n=1 Tax=Oryza sativa subsp. japonica TaxID=39947 RepID=A0A0P0Y9W7_ORYSJ|nr:Os12g0444600 [Oryza sativa Japonica Group]
MRTMKTGAGEDLASGSVRGDGGGGGGKERPHGQRWTAAAAAHREDLVSGGGGWGRRRLRATDGDDVVSACGRPRWMGKLQRWGRPRLSFSARRRRKGTTTRVSRALRG